MLLPKPNLKLSLTTTAIAFIAGVAVLYPSSPKPQNVRLSDSTTPTTSTSTPTATDPTQTSTSTSGTSSSPASSTSGSTTPTSSTSTPTSSTSPSDSSSSPTTSSATTSSTTSQTQAPSPPAPSVTAVSATLSDWTAPVPGLSGSAIEPSTVQYQYCTYAYSDGTTQNVLHDTKTTYNDGVIGDSAGLPCTLDNAPAGK